MQGRSYTKSQMAIAYNVPAKVFTKWLKDLSEVISTGKRKYLSPKEIEIITKEKGQPQWDLIPEH